MLVIPNAVYSFFAARNTHTNSDDVHEEVEKGPYHTQSNSQHHNFLDSTKFSHILPRRHQHRPSNLDLNDDLNEPSRGLDTLVNNTQDPDSTRTYRILPIFSGIMIPFSIMLSIPSLTGHWYVRTGENHTLLEVRPNPIILNVAMGLSMGCGVLGSACLVVRFAERMIKWMTLLCVLFLTLHDVINIISVTVFGVVHRFDDGFTYGQSFWFTVCSTIASTATNITLIYDYYHTENFRNSGSGLTHKQRSLLIITIVLLCYVSFGSLVQACMLKIPFIDALYFSILSIETIGYGDIIPNSTGTRIFTCLYITGGILNLALAVALSREALLEAAAVGFQARIKAVQMRNRANRIRSRWRAAIRWRLRSEGLPTWVDDNDEEQQNAVVGRGRRRHRCCSWFGHAWIRLWAEEWREWEDPTWKYVYGSRHKRLNLTALSPEQLETAALEAGAPLSELIPKGLKLPNRADDEGGNESANDPASRFPETHYHPPLTHVRMGGMLSVLRRFAVAFTHGTHIEQMNASTADDGNVDTAYEESFKPSGRGVPMTRSLTMTTTLDDEEDLSESLKKEEQAAFYTRLGIAWSLFLTFWMAGSAIFMKTEKWTFGDAAYFCFISFTTVGYGDFAPRTPAGRSIFVVWALLGVGTMTILISILAEAYSSSYRSMIKTEDAGPTSAATFDFPVDRNHRFCDSCTVLNTGTVQDSPSLSTALPENPIIAFAPSPSTPRFGRSLKTNMAPIPELQQLNATDEISLAQRRVNEKLEALPHQVLSHAYNVRSIFGISRTVNGDPLARRSSSSEGYEAITAQQRMEDLIAELERSLHEIVDAARDALDTNFD